MARRCRSATSRTSTTANDACGSRGGLPCISIWIRPREVGRSGPRAGPKMPTGFTTDSPRPTDGSATKSHAARSASILLLTYGVTSPVGSVQSVSSYGSPDGFGLYPIAANEDVSTTRRAPASLAARNTRSVPSRAGTTRSSAFRGCCGGNGDATCSTYSQPATAGGHPSSIVRSAVTKNSCVVSAPARCSVVRTSGARSSDRTVVRTRYPSLSSRRMICVARNPEPPVINTGAVVSCMACVRLFSQYLGGKFVHRRTDGRLRGGVAPFPGGPELGLGRHVPLAQSQPGDLAPKPIRMAGEELSLVRRRDHAAPRVGDVGAHVLHRHSSAA